MLQGHGTKVRAAPWLAQTRTSISNLCTNKCTAFGPTKISLQLTHSPSEYASLSKVTRIAHLVQIASPSGIFKLEPRRQVVRNVPISRDMLIWTSHRSRYCCDRCRRDDRVIQVPRRHRRHLDVVFVLPSPLLDDRWQWFCIAPDDLELEVFEVGIIKTN